MIGDRWRLVFKLIRADGTTEESVSTIALSSQDARDQIVGEGYLHKISGWEVTVKDGGIVCERNGTRREVSARRYGPMDDVHHAPNS